MAKKIAVILIKITKKKKKIAVVSSSIKNGMAIFVGIELNL